MSSLVRSCALKMAVSPFTLLSQNIRESQRKGKLYVEPWFQVLLQGWLAPLPLVL